MRLERELQRLLDAGLDEVGLCAAAAERIACVVPYDGCCVSSSAPGTLVLTQTHTRGIPAEQFAMQFYESEYGPPDYSRHRDLVAHRRHAAVLGALTRGEPARCARYRRLLAPMEVEHELRVAALTRGAPWGFVHLYRRPGRRDFDADELAAVRRAGPWLAEALRAAAARGSAWPAGGSRWSGPCETPATILVGGGLEVLAVAGPAREWLAAMRDPSRPGEALPVVVMSIVLGVRLGADVQRARVLGPDGVWWSLSASPLEDDEHTDTVAVTIEPARGRALGEVQMLALGLTPGERGVCELVLAGASTKLIASTLCLSAYTVQDRLKSIFAKAGVGSRGQLVARLGG